MKRIKKNEAAAFGILTAALLAGCTAETDQAAPQSYSIQVSAALEPTTKATDITFETGDRFGLYVTERHGTEPGGPAGPRYLDNEPCLQTENGVELAPENYPNNRVDFYAYYPYAEEGATPGSNLLPFSVKTDQSADRAYTLSDLMYASTSDVAASGSPVPLLFRHSLARIDVRLTAGTGFDSPARLEGATLKAKDLPTGCELNLETGAVGGQNSPADMVPKGNGATVNGEEVSLMSLVVVPQTITAGKELFEITADGSVLVYVQEQEKELAPGSRTLFEITLVRGAARPTARITSLP